MATPEESHQPLPTISEISDAYAAALTHNEDHNGLLATSLAALVSDLSTEADFSDYMSTRADQAEMSTGMWEWLHSETFDRAGLALGTLDEHLPEGATAASAVRLVPIVIDPTRYVAFLGTLQPADVEAGVGYTLLGDVVDTIRRTGGLAYGQAEHLETEVDEAELRWRGDNALRVFDTVDNEYARLNVGTDGLRRRIATISPALSRFMERGGQVPRKLEPEYVQYLDDMKHLRNYTFMTNCLSYQGRGLLSEYLAAEHYEYMTPPELQSPHGPSLWHENRSPAMWAEAVAFVWRMESDERTNVFGREVRDNLVRSLDSAIAGTRKGWRRGYFASQRGGLVSLRDMLSGQDYNATVLADYLDTGRR